MNIDSGIGSLLFQILLGLLLAIPIFLKLYWAKRKKADKQKNPPVKCRIGFILSVMAGCFVVLSVFSTHAHRLMWSQLLPALALGAIIGLFIWVVFYALPLTRSASAVISCVVTVMLMTWTVYPYLIIPEMVMMSTIIVLYDIKPSLNRRIARLTSVIVVIAILVALGQSLYTKTTFAGDEGISPDTEIILEQTPDIYFIVPDRFASIGALEESGLDMGDFVAELESRGFYVRQDATSEDKVGPSGDALASTTRTLRFMASILNMGEEIDLRIPYNQASNKVKYHAVGRILRENGYTYHHIGDWWQETMFNPSADYNYIYKGYSLIDFFAGNELAAAIIDMSFLRDANASSLISRDALAETNRCRNMYQLATFKDIAGNGEHPKFVFAHILLPHPPYTWAKDGSTRTESIGTMNAYLEQVQFTEGYLLQMIDAIKETDSIIIIQSDEGIGLFSEAENEQLGFNQWNGVLTAWYVPGEDMRDVSITSVLKYVIDILE